jgi:adenylate cyclase
MLHPERQVIDWLLAPEVRDLDDGWMFSQLVKRLLDAGVPLWRAATSVRTNFAEVSTHDLVWRRGVGTDVSLGSALDDDPGSAQNLAKGLQREPLRIPLSGPPDSIPFRIAYQLKAEGGTDCLLYRLPMSQGKESYVWWATDHRAGFRQHHIELLSALVPALSLRIELSASQHALEDLLMTYLGPLAARRVHEGEVRRGRGKQLPAVLWLSDLHGFASLTQRHPINRVLNALDAYVECVSAPIVHHGGHVLSLHGDGLLAAFPSSGQKREEICREALTAAREAFASMAELNAERRMQSSEAIAFRVALHLGVFTYGAVGPGAPLHHVALGATVDELFALEALGKRLTLPLLASSAFARNAASDDLASIGHHNLLRDGGSDELYSLRAFAERTAGRPSAHP